MKKISINLVCFFICIILGQIAYAQESEDSAFGKTESLNENETLAAKGYIHQGKFDREYAEKCKKNPKICMDDGKAFQTATGKTVEQMVPMASKMYAAYFGLSNNKLPFKPGPNVQLKDAKQSEDKFDYCFIPTMLVEIVSTATLAMQTKPVEDQIKNKATGIQQLDALYIVADQHTQRSKAALIQEVGWGASAACYTALVTQSLISGSGGKGVVTKGKAGATVYAKLASAVLLTVFYEFVRKAHVARAQVVNDFANSLPHRGDCNPLTEAFCFCNEQTTKQSDPVLFAKHCMPREYNDPTRAFSPISCLDSKQQVDHTCKCRQTNSCLVKNYMANLGNLPEFSGMNQGIFQGLKSLDNGTFIPGDLLNNANANLAYAKKFLKDHPELGSDIETNKNPTPLQKKLYDDLINEGIPSTLAKMMSSAPEGGSSRASIAGLGESMDFKNSKIDKDSLKKIQQVGHLVSARGGAFNKKSGKDETNPFASLFNKGGDQSSSSGGVQIEEFSNKAVSQSEIHETNSNDSNIFDYITFRYKQSTWKELINSEVK